MYDSDTSSSPSDRLGRLPSSRLAEYDLSVPQVRALESLLSGATVTDAAEAAGVHRSTVHRWRREDPDFQAALSGLREGLQERVVDRLLAAADDAADTVARAVAEDDDPNTAFRLLRGLGLLNGQRPETGTSGPVLRRADQAISERQLRALLSQFSAADRERSGTSLLELLVAGLVDALDEHNEEVTDAELLDALFDRAIEAGLTQKKPRSAGYLTDQKGEKDE